MDAKIVVEFIISNVCSKDDIEDTGLSFEQIVKDVIDNEGLMGLVDDPQGRIISIREIK